MTAAFVVQTDDGTTAGANAYVDLTFFKNYHDSLGNDYSGFTDDQLKAVIVRGTAYVDTRFQYKGVQLLGATVAAVGTLTASQNFATAEAVTIGSRTYTFQSSLTNVDGNVQLGGDLATSLANLANAIDSSGTPGTDYAAAMTKNSNITANLTTSTLLVTAANLGFGGNAIVSTTTAVHATWGAATLSGGVGPQTTKWPRQATQEATLPWFDINFLTPMVDTQIGPQGFVALVDPSGTQIIGIPDAVKQACSEYSLRALSFPLWQDAPAPVGGRLIRSLSQSVDVVKQDITYEPGQAGAFALPAYPAADMILVRAGLTTLSRTLYR